jgi:hypothetical protein
MALGWVPDKYLAAEWRRISEVSKGWNNTCKKLLKIPWEEKVEK